MYQYVIYGGTNFAETTHYGASFFLQGTHSQQPEINRSAHTSGAACSFSLQSNTTFPKHSLCPWTISGNWGLG